MKEPGNKDIHKPEPKPKNKDVNIEEKPDNERKEQEERA